MWDVPQPQGIPDIDACPRLELQDNVSDFTDTLKSIYDSFHFDNLPPNADLTTLLTFLSGILRITTKYNMQQLRNKCIALLCQKFPSTLSGCDAVIAQQYQYTPSTIVRLIPLARENNIPEVLPWAYYICTQMSIPDLLANPVLSWQDKALCLAGKERLREARKTTTHPFLLDLTRSLQCSGGTCATGLRRPTANWRESEDQRSLPHPIVPYRDWTALGTCTRCTAVYEAQHRVEREKV